MTQRLALSDDFAFRGLVHQVSGPGVMPMLDKGGVTVYTGFDPTAGSLHVGHLLPLLTLRRLQEAGNRPVVVAGGGTGMIGDPSGRSEERNLLSAEEVAANLEGIRGQLVSLLDFSVEAGPARAVLEDNARWLSEVRLLDFLRDVGKHFSVSTMIAKESVKARLETREEGISFTEFSYMLLQAFDFLHLFDEHGCTVQMGASDQWGNITMGIELIRRSRGAEAHGFTIPLLTRADGTKFGKTAEGTVWLDPERTSPYELYQFLLNVEDESVGTLLRYLTFLPHEEISALEESTKSAPERREAQRRLAAEVVTLVHGSEALQRSGRVSDALFSGVVEALSEDELLEVCRGAPTTDMAMSRLEEGLLVAQCMAEVGLEASKAAARRTISQGGAYINGRRVDDPDAVVTSDQLIAKRYVLLRKGKKHHHLLRFQ